MGAFPFLFVVDPIAGCGITLAGIYLKLNLPSNTINQDGRQQEKTQSG
jgi:hypothetical protein